jgi:hypothetical protein
MALMSVRIQGLSITLGVQECMERLFRSLHHPSTHSDPVVAITLTSPLKVRLSIQTNSLFKLLDRLKQAFS